MRPRAPIDFKREEKPYVIYALDRIKAYLENLRGKIRSILSVPLSELDRSLQRVEEAREFIRRHESLQSESTDAIIIAGALRFYLLEISRDAEQRRRKTANIEVHAKIDEPVEATRSVCSYFHGLKAYRFPKISDYFVLSEAEKLSAESGGLKKPQRILDEKFRILLSPQGFAEDLRYYRESCAIRDVPLCVAFIDIDNFKRFNEAHTEPVVDRSMLPQFMMALEAHIYPWGYAYRQGGDEYLCLIPNAHAEEASHRLNGFQEALSRMKYQGVGDERVTVSIGVCEIKPDSYLTEQQALDASARAKKHAKEQKDKGKIAYFADDQDALGLNATATIWRSSGEEETP